MEPTFPIPPANTPEAPRRKAPASSRHKELAIAILGFTCLGGLLLFLTAPYVPKPSKSRPHRIEAINNLRQLSTALDEFDAKYGKFPDASTIAVVQADSGTKLALGDASSNDLLRQLIATELAKSEKPFWGRCAATPRKPDGDMSPGKALEAGECSFAYVAGLSRSADGSAPLAFGPVVRGTHRFDPDAFGEMAVVLRVDGSVTPMRIRRDNGQIASGVQGMDILDPRHGYWQGKTPPYQVAGVSRNFLRSRYEAFVSGCP